MDEKIKTPPNDPVEEQETKICEDCECPVDECECDCDCDCDWFRDEDEEEEEEEEEDEPVFSITLEAEGSIVHITKPQTDQTWMEILDTFWGMLQAVGFHCDAKTQERFETLINKE